MNSERCQNLGFIYEESDSMYSRCILPTGWKTVDNTHCWSSIMDENGRERATYFIADGFEKPDAFLEIECRYSHSNYIYCNRKGEFSKNVNTHLATVIIDKNDNNYIHTIGIRQYLNSIESNELDNKHCNDAKEYLDKNFPDWQNPLAYWE